MLIAIAFQTSENINDMRRMARYGFSVVRFILGVLLLIAAGLKFADGDVGVVGGLGSFASSFWPLPC